MHAECLQLVAEKIARAACAARPAPSGAGRSGSARRRGVRRLRDGASSLQRPLRSPHPRQRRGTTRSASDPRQRDPVVGAGRMILHGGDAGGRVLRHAGAVSRAGRPTKRPDVDGNRPVLHAAEPERQMPPAGHRARGEPGKLPPRWRNRRAAARFRRTRGLRRRAPRGHSNAVTSSSGRRCVVSAPRKNSRAAHTALAPARPQHHRAAANDEAERDLGARIGMRYRAPERAAVAGLEMSDPRQGHGAAAAHPRDDVGPQSVAPGRRRRP